MDKNILISDAPCQSLRVDPSLVVTPQERPPGEGERSDPLLYLNSNNSDESQKNLSKLTPYHKKKAHILEKDVDKFVSQVGINRVLFLSLTFIQNIIDNKEASRRFNNLNRRFLSVFFGRWMLVKERQDRGAWHYHILVEVPFDVRSGFDFATYKLIGHLRKSPAPWSKKGGKIRKYERKLARSARPHLRAYWNLLNSSMKKYGFGRPHAAPIESNVEAISKYVGKYISKHMDKRIKEDKGVRLTSTSKDFHNSSPKMSWNTDGAKEWRRKVDKFASIIGLNGHDDMREIFGPRWAYHWEYLILNVDTITPSEVGRLVVIVEKRRKFLNAPPIAFTSDDTLVDLRTGEELF